MAPIKCWCVVCTEEFSIDETDAGKLVKCPHCGVSVKPKTGPAGATAEAIVEAARAEGAERLVQKEFVLRKGKALGRLRITRRDAGGPLRWPTTVAGCASAIGLAAAWIACRNAGLVVHSTTFYTMLFGFLIGGLALVVFLPLLMQDLSVPQPGGRTTPAKGLEAFFGAMRLGNFRYAHKCLLPVERNLTPRAIPNTEPSFQKGAGRTAFDTEAGFREYWRLIIRSSFLTGRSVEVGVFGPKQEVGDFALMTCLLNVTKTNMWRALLRAAVILLHNPLLHLLLSKESPTWTVETRKLMRRVDGQWYVVNGELHGPEDDAFEDAVRIAALSDGELAALAGGAAPPG